MKFMLAMARKRAGLVSLGLAVSAVVLALSQSADPALAQPQAAAPSGAPHPGEALYRANCAGCHDNTEVSRAPTRQTLGAMRFQIISYALTLGKMKDQAAGLSPEQKAQLINYLTGRSTATMDDWTGPMMCPADRRQVNLSGAVSVAGFGFNRDNTRAMTAREAGLTKAQLSNMELAWAFAFPGATMMRSQPAIVGDNIFLPVGDASALYAIDIARGRQPCIKWIYHSPGGAPLRTSAAYGVIADGRGVLAFLGIDSTLHVVDAKTGRALWTKNIARYRHTMSTGAPTVLRDRIIVPVSQHEISFAGNNRELCCTHKGYVLSLDPRNGNQQWVYDTMEDARPIRDRGDGQMLWGPSGAPIWNSPIVDQRRGLIYFGTGEANSPPAHRNTNAVIAINLADGKERWSMQATPNDIYNSGCTANPRPDQYNCVKETVYRDVDFGGSALLGRLKNGREVVFIGQKSGTVWALNPNTGKVVWRHDIGTGSALGGIHWGIAFQDDTVYAPIARPGNSIPGQYVSSDIKPGLYAVDANTGRLKWAFPNVADCSGDRQERVPSCAAGGLAMSAAPTVVDGAVIQGSLDGYLRVIDGANGRELWKFDTARSLPTINGVPGKGGAIDAATVTAANGMVFVNSGYGNFGQVPGNMFMAFRPKAN